MIYEVRLKASNLTKDHLALLFFLTFPSTIVASLHCYLLDHHQTANYLSKQFQVKFCFLYFCLAQRRTVPSLPLKVLQIDPQTDLVGILFKNSLWLA